MTAYDSLLISSEGSASGILIQNLADPKYPQDAATKNYVDNQMDTNAAKLGNDNTFTGFNVFQQVIFKSPNGTCWNASIDDTGNLKWLTVGCP